MDPDSDGWPLADWIWAGSVSFLGGSLTKAEPGKPGGEVGGELETHLKLKLSVPKISF